MSGVLGGLIGSFARRVAQWTQTTPSAYVPTPRGAAMFTVGGVPSVLVFGSNGSNASTTYSQFSVANNTQTNRSLPASYRYGVAAASSSTVMVAASDRDIAYVSTNGTSWTFTELDLSLETDMNDLIHDGTRFLCLTNEGLAFYITSWTAINVTGSALGFNGTSSYIAAGLSGTAYRRCLNANPTVLANWVTGTLPTPGGGGYYSSVVFGNGIWVAAVPNTTNYATSTDGITWTSRTLPSNFSNNNAIRARMVFFDGAFYYYYINNVYKSTDGINWATNATFSDTALDNLMAWAKSDTLYGFGVDTLATTTVKPFIRLGLG